MDELKKDIKDIKTDVNEIKVRVVSNTVSLDNHMKRTELNEHRIDRIEKWQLGLVTAALLALIAGILRK